MESRMRSVNDQYIPLLKALSQLDSHQYLLGRELGRAIELGQAKPDSVHMQMMRKKIASLRRLFSSGPRANEAIKERLVVIETAFDNFIQNTNNVFSYPLDNRYRDAFSTTKSEFEANLKDSLRFLDREIRSRSLQVEYDISQSISLVAGLLATFLLLAAGVVLWVDNMLDPLQKLTDIVKTISTRGLRRSDISLLSRIQTNQDELGIFANEFTKMSSSVFEQNLQLINERKNLRRAKETLKNQNEALRKTRAKLVHQEKLGLVGKLSAQMAHEIRNPLNALSLHLENLEFEIQNSPKHFLESVDCMKREISRLDSVSSSYLNLAKSPKLNFERVNLLNLVKEALDVYTPLLKENNIQIYTKLSVGPEILGDRNNLLLVIGNLIKNSCEALCDTKFPKKEKRWLLFSIQENEDSKYVVLEVADNGPGIASENIESMFSPFFTTKASGTGLGLSHSKQIIDAHGGEISFHNRSNGMTFLIQLPIDGGGNV